MKVGEPKKTGELRIVKVKARRPVYLYYFFKKAGFPEGDVVAWIESDPVNKTVCIRLEKAFKVEEA